MPENREQRLRNANALLVVIAYHGRHFFLHAGKVSYLEIAENGRVWFHDSYSQRKVYTHTNGRWRGFTEGGTLRSLVQELKDYVVHGRTLSTRKLGPWPAWICEGDLWGYGEEMRTVRQVAQALGMLKPGPLREAEAVAAD